MFGDLLNGFILPLLSIVFILCFAHIRFRRLKWKGPPVIAWLVGFIAALAVIGQLVTLAKYVKAITGI